MGPPIRALNVPPDDFRLRWLQSASQFITIPHSFASRASATTFPEKQRSRLFKLATMADSTAPPVFETKATITTFGGTLLKLSHQSSTTGTSMALNLFLPPKQESASPSKSPLLVYLSGLTCSPDNCTEKGFLHAHASKLNLALLWPDTSPRGLELPGEHDSWDFGSAASFYIDATQPPWSSHYRMETYLTQELPALVFKAFGDRIDADRVSIAGHSMGGHGALTLHLKNPGMYKSVSAWAPISNPGKCPWGDKAFSGYLGKDREEWRKHDATELVKGWKGPLNCLVDVASVPPLHGCPAGREMCLG
jgi:S-formylglutathione hydrolase